MQGKKRFRLHTIYRTILKFNVFSDNNVVKNYNYVLMLKDQNKAQNPIYFKHIVLHKTLSMKKIK